MKTNYAIQDTFDLSQDLLLDEDFDTLALEQDELPVELEITEWPY